MLHITIDEQTADRCTLHVMSGEKKLPLLIIEITERTDGIQISLETPDAVEPNLVFERYRQESTDIVKTVLQHHMVSDSEELLFHVAEGQGEERRHHLQVFSKDGVSTSYPDGLRLKALELSDAVRHLFLLGIDQER